MAEGDDQLFLVTREFVARVEALERWVRGFSLTGDGLRVSRSGQSFSANLRLPTPVPQSSSPAGPEVFRMKVVTAAAGGLAGQTWDGTTMGGTDIYVKFIQGHAVGDEFYAAKVSGDTNQTGGDGQPVGYLELLALTPDTHRFRLVQVVDATGRLGIDSARYE